jgi:hypothetical protein
VCWTYRCVGKKVVTVECSDDEEDAEEEDFSDGKRFLGRQRER